MKEKIQRITEFLDINLNVEQWQCNRCGQQLGDARDNYKNGLLVFERDPREIHRPLINPDEFQYTFAPDPDWCRILEYYCPKCGTMMETEYLVPGHPITRDIELDIEWLKKAAAKEEER